MPFQRTEPFALPAKQQKRLDAFMRKYTVRDDDHTIYTGGSIDKRAGCERVALFLCGQAFELGRLLWRLENPLTDLNVGEHAHRTCGMYLCVEPSHRLPATRALHMNESFVSGNNPNARLTADQVRSIRAALDEHRRKWYAKRDSKRITRTEYAELTIANSDKRMQEIVRLDKLGQLHHLIEIGSMDARALDDDPDVDPDWRDDVLTPGKFIAQLANLYSVSVRTIQAIDQGHTWTSVTGRPRAGRTPQTPLTLDNMSADIAERVHDGIKLVMHGVVYANTEPSHERVHEPVRWARMYGLVKRQSRLKYTVTPLAKTFLDTHVCGQEYTT